MHHLRAQRSSRAVQTGFTTHFSEIGDPRDPDGIPDERTNLSSGTKARASELNCVIAERASASVGSRRHVATTAATMWERAAASSVSKPPMLAPKRMTG